MYDYDYEDPVIKVFFEMMKETLHILDRERSMRKDRIKKGEDPRSEKEKAWDSYSDDIRLMSDIFFAFGNSFVCLKTSELVEAYKNMANNKA